MSWARFSAVPSFGLVLQLEGLQRACNSSLILAPVQVRASCGWSFYPGVACGMYIRAGYSPSLCDARKGRKKQKNILFFLAIPSLWDSSHDGCEWVTMGWIGNCNSVSLGIAGLLHLWWDFSKAPKEQNKGAFPELEAPLISGYS